ncbi:MAG: metallophosphoesterase [Clostridia bacterium]|nr:metallophosphoesterase [Clostridia bacterium]
MRILLMSDSHGNTNNIIKAIKKNKDIDIVIHLGDMLSDILKVMEGNKHIRYECVPGNNDWAREYPSEKVLDLEGKKVFITHGHHYNVKYDYQRIIVRGRAIGADAVFFGHTHIAEEMFSDGMMVLNPGSISLPSQSRIPTYSLIEIKDGRLVSRFMGI